MTTSPIATEQHHARSVASLRTVTALVGTYLAVSVLTLGAIILLRDNPAIVNTAVWIRGTIVVGSAALMLVFVRRASGGAARAFLRVRLISAIMLVAIIVIIALPGTFPLWMKLEQAVCGLLLLVVVILVNGRRLRSFFAAR
ncbi:MAG TPA: hypothetical protein VHU90_08120 [Galbitalea sp.]|nr:hypothetical protein [Galbitalea sp.]